MALIKCPKCGGNVSSAAKNCPHCGLSISGLRYCAECNAIITENDAYCQMCGCPTPWSRDLIKCPECGGVVRNTAETCPHCGLDISDLQHCAECNAIISENDAFCGMCGAPTPWSHELIKCPECGGVVRNTAETCPHCGFKISDLKYCAECNAIITEDQASCPECGSPTPWSRKCPQCGIYMLPTEETCPECGFDMASVYGHVNILNSNVSESFQPNNESEYSTDNYNEKPSKKKWILIGIAIVAIVGVILGVNSYNGHKAKIAYEKHIADSIRAEEERIAAIEAEKAAEEEAERKRIEEEEQRIKRMYAATQGTYLFRGCQKDKKFRTNYTYGGYYDTTVHEYPDGKKTWDVEIKIDSDGKVHVREINMVETDRYGSVIERKDVAYDHGIVGEVELISDGVFRLRGKSQDLLYGAQPRPGAYSRGGNVAINKCIFDNNSNLLYSNYTDYQNRDGYDEVLAMPYTHTR